MSHCWWTQIDSLNRPHETQLTSVQESLKSRCWWDLEAESQSSLPACDRRDLPPKLCGLTQVCHAHTQPTVRWWTSSDHFFPPGQTLLNICDCNVSVSLNLCLPKMFLLSAGCKAPEKWITVILCPDRGRGGGRRKRRSSGPCLGGLALSRSAMTTSIMTSLTTS